ncbi:hypothetical protein BT96DRAFT_822841, partial [Gymnopus androsaceus JB14]
QLISFNTLMSDLLDQCNIRKIATLRLKSSIDEKIKESKTIATDKLWSYQNTYSHLRFLEMTVSRTTECAARLWIDTMYFRANALLDSKKSMLLQVKQTIKPALLSSLMAESMRVRVDYTTTVFNPEDSCMYLCMPFQIHHLLTHKRLMS